MSVSVINGFLCFCDCDVAKAKKGEDPKKTPDPNAKSLQDQEKERISGGSRSADPAVVFGGARAGPANSVAAVDAAQAAVALGRQRYPSTVDLLI